MAKHDELTRKAPCPADKIVGRNIRIYRLAKGLSQTELADQLGVTFQQVQKYEKGANRVGAGRLLKISLVLGISVEQLFEGANNDKEKGHGSIFDQLAEPQSHRLVSAFSAISNQKIRNSIVELLETISRKH